MMSPMQKTWPQNLPRCLLAFQVLSLPGIQHMPSANQELGALTKELAIEELEY
jgi:hypothetical protein